MNTYTPAFKAKLVQRLLGPGRMSQGALSRETGVPQATLSNWLKEATTVGAMPKRKSAGETKTSKPSAERSAEEKFRLLLEASKLEGEELGAFLRREGLHDSTLEEWRADALVALAPDPKSGNRAGPAKRIQELERQLHRKDKALAEAAALLMLQKKVQALWAVADDDTEPPTDD
jgi:transposase-like protein